MKNLLVATINHNDEDRRLKIACRRNDDGRYRWYDTETDDDCGLPAADNLKQAADYAGMAWGSDAWQLKATWY